MYVITSTATTIVIAFNQDSITLQKSDLSGIATRNGTLRFVGDNNAGIFYMVYSNGISVDGVTQTSLSMAVSTLTALIVRGLIENFIATAGQTAFTTSFTASSTTVRIYQDGIRNTLLTGWTFVAGVPTYASGMTLGTVVGIESI